MWRLAVIPVYENDEASLEEEAKRVHSYLCDEAEPLVRLMERMMQMANGEYQYIIRPTE